ncbi:MAG: hypothetical protein ACK411_07855 [Exiguobacterium mexicanum]
MRKHWLEHAAYLNESITLTASGKPRYGTMRGISEEGALLLEQEGIIEPIYSAEIAVWND